MLGQDSATTGVDLLCAILPSTLFIMAYQNLVKPGSRSKASAPTPPTPSQHSLSTNAVGLSIQISVALEVDSGSANPILNPSTTSGFGNTPTTGSQRAD